MNEFPGDPEREVMSGNARLIELIDNPGLIGDSIILLREYGQYMYGELGLIAGKESFLNQLKDFPGGAYYPPSGTFIVVRVGDASAGCAGIKEFDKDSCEMKRMYIRPPFRGKGIGRLLCSYVIDWCRKKMYSRILLDTNVEMKEAVSLYRKCGFVEIPPYCINENEHPVFMEYVL